MQIGDCAVHPPRDPPAPDRKVDQHEDEKVWQVAWNTTRPERRKGLNVRSDLLRQQGRIEGISIYGELSESRAGPNNLACRRGHRRQKYSGDKCWNVYVWQRHHLLQPGGIIPP